MSAVSAFDRRAITPLFGIVVIDGLDPGVVLSLLPFYARQFGANPLLIGVLIASYSPCEAIASPRLGRLSDHYGAQAHVVCEPAWHHCGPRPVRARRQAVAAVSALRRVRPARHRSRDDRLPGRGGDCGNRDRSNMAS